MIRSHRADEIRQAVRWHGRELLRRRGKPATTDAAAGAAGLQGSAMASLTIRHENGADLALLRRTLSEAHRLLLAGAPWKRWQRRLGFVGLVRALENTHGPHGWHPHLHDLLLCSVGPDADPKLWNEFAVWLANRWQSCVIACSPATKATKLEQLADQAEAHALEPAGSPALQLVREKNAARARVRARNARELSERCGRVIPDLDHGVVVSQARQDNYLAKLGCEISDTGYKRAAPGHRTPTELMVAAAEGDTNAQRLWSAYAAGQFGARFLTWSRGLRASAGLEDEKEDQAVVDGEAGGESVLRIAGALWDRVRDVPRLPVALLEASEANGAAGALEVLAPYAIRATRIAGVLVAAFDPEALQPRTPDPEAEQRRDRKRKLEQLRALGGLQRPASQEAVGLALAALDAGPGIVKAGDEFPPWLSREPTSRDDLEWEYWNAPALDEARARFRAALGWPDQVG